MLNPSVLSFQFISSLLLAYMWLFFQVDASETSTKRVVENKSEEYVIVTRDRDIRAREAIMEVIRH
jgi:hypothetical protein